mgnify:CR=1 FL=1
MKDSFLSNVARDLWERYGANVGSVTMIFPSRRAGFFFREALSEIADTPLWSPQATSVDCIAEQLCGLVAGDRIRMVAELYKIYSKYHCGQDGEPFEDIDSFYFWGEALIADFDMVDKYMVDADMLYCNLADLHDLDSFHNLEPEQIRLIENFWKNIDKDIDTYIHKKKFTDVWRTLAPIYHQFRARLEELGIGYNGMIYRKAAEKIKEGSVPQLKATNIAVVGLNALCEAEKRIFKYLQNNYTVDFYWDYDKYYLDNEHNEAGVFMRDNLQNFPMRASFNTDMLSTPKSIKVVSAPSDVSQCKYVGQRLASLGVVDKQTAIILTDESLLTPTLYSLPNSVQDVNVTMGYPIRYDIAYSFCERLIELQRRKRTGKSGVTFYHSDVTGLLSHAYIAEHPASRDLVKTITDRRMIYVPQELFEGRPLLEDIFTPHSGGREVACYIKEILGAVMHAFEGDIVRNEIFAIVVEQIDKLLNSVETCGISLEEKTYITLLRKLLQSTTIPFEGEPLVGLQIMGFLESRALDFRNIIILSMSDDHCPGNRNSSVSYIPYNLRKAYGIPANEEQEAMYAYYFYRMLQRAENIELVYCSRADEKNTGEQSRYISQLIYESDHKIEREDIRLNVTSEEQRTITVEKSGEVKQKLYQWLDNPTTRLSHSRFFKFIECPLKFYFGSIANLQPLDEMTEEVDSSIFGNILHYSMHDLYEELIGVHNPGPQIKAMINSQNLRDVVTKAVNKAYMRRENSLDTDDWGGTLRMIRNVVLRYINTNILPFDAAKEGYTILKLEDPNSASFEVEVDGSKHSVQFYGEVDRIDRLDDGTIEVIDYKTGRPKGGDKNVNEQISSIDALFNGTGDEVISAVLQTLLYSEILSREHSECNIRPTLYYVRKMRKDYTPLIMDKERGAPITSYADYADEFREQFGGALARLFDTSQPFTQTTNEKACTYCDFKTLCGKQK